MKPVLLVLGAALFVYAGCQPRVPRGNSGQTHRDAGQPVVDSGADVGSSADAATLPGTDTPALIDAGTIGRQDLGPVRLPEAGQPQDSGIFSLDIGLPPPPDAGASDAGLPQPPEAGPADSGAAQRCESEADCPLTQYCNHRDSRCADLPPGTCRDDRSCQGHCLIPEGRGVGRCIDCQDARDCAPGERCTNGICAPPPCRNNNDCPAGQRCVAGQCAQAGPCNAQTCPPPRQCVQDRCVEQGGNNCRSDRDCADTEQCVQSRCVEQGGNNCRSHRDCADTEQCLDLGGQRLCISKCNAGIFALQCQQPNNPLCPCTMAGLSCNQQTGYCE